MQNVCFQNIASAMLCSDFRATIISTPFIRTCVCVCVCENRCLCLPRARAYLQRTRKNSLYGKRAQSCSQKLENSSVFYIQAFRLVYRCRQHNTVSFSRKRLIPFRRSAFIVNMYFCQPYLVSPYLRVFRCAPCHSILPFSACRMANTHTHTHTDARSYIHPKNHQPYFYFFLRQIYAQQSRT